jgi:hypothetical protein
LKGGGGGAGGGGVGELEHLLGLPMGRHSRLPTAASVSPPAVGRRERLPTGRPNNPPRPHSAHAARAPGPPHTHLAARAVVVELGARPRERAVRVERQHGRLVEAPEVLQVEVVHRRLVADHADLHGHPERAGFKGRGGAVGAGFSVRRQRRAGAPGTKQHEPPRPAGRLETPPQIPPPPPPPAAHVRTLPLSSTKPVAGPSGSPVCTTNPSARWISMPS